MGPSRDPSREARQGDSEALRWYKGIEHIRWKPSAQLRVCVPCFWTEHIRSKPSFGQHCAARRGRIMASFDPAYLAVDEGPSASATITGPLVVCTFFVGLRFWGRWSQGISLGSDDWTLAVSLVLTWCAGGVVWGSKFSKSRLRIPQTVRLGDAAC